MSQSSLTVYQNSLLKLLIRSGPNSDRLQVALDVGELGYTVDNKRVYVGDGFTLGGNVVGNLYKGSVASVLTITDPISNDLAFDTTYNTLYSFISGNPANSSNWRPVGAIYSSGSPSLSVYNNTITILPLSSYSVASNALGSSLEIASGQISLAPTISADKIVPKTATYVEMFSSVRINNLTYKFPSVLSASAFLQTDGSGNLAWTSISALSVLSASNVTLSTGLTATANGTATSTFNMLTGGNVVISCLQPIAAHITFKQDGSVMKSVNSTTVTTRTFGQVSSEIINGVPLLESQSRWDAPAVGAYRVTIPSGILTPFTLSSAVVDVQAKNATYRYDNNDQQVYDNTLSCYYKLVNETTIDVIYYVTSTNVAVSNNRFSASTGACYVTPGATNENTRFSVTIYG